MHSPGLQWHIVTFSTYTTHQYFLKLCNEPPSFFQQAEITEGQRAGWSEDYSSCWTKANDVKKKITKVGSDWSKIIRKGPKENLWWRDRALNRALVCFITCPLIEEWTGRWTPNTCRMCGWGYLKYPPGKSILLPKSLSVAPFYLILPVCKESSCVWQISVGNQAEAWICEREGSKSLKYLLLSFS